MRLKRCPYCPARVPDLANHYAGYRVPPCPDVLRAFGPDRPRDRSAEAVLPPEARSALLDFTRWAFHLSRVVK